MSLREANLPTVLEMQLENRFRHCLKAHAFCELQSSVTMLNFLMIDMKNHYRKLFSAFFGKSIMSQWESQDKVSINQFQQ